MTYKLGFSSGLWRLNPIFQLMGIGRKIQSVATYGVNYAQVDIESIAEFNEPDLLRMIRQAVDDLGIRWGMHGEISETVAWDAGLDVDWNISHRRLHEYLDALYELFIKKRVENGKEFSFEKYKPDYIDFHISMRTSLVYIFERFRFQGWLTVDFNGRKDWNELMDKNPELKKWFVDNLLYPIISRERPAFGSEKAVGQEMEYLLYERDIIGLNTTEEVLREEADMRLQEQLKQNPNITPQELAVLTNKITAQVQAEKRDILIKRNLLPADKYELYYTYWLEGSKGRTGKGVLDREEWAAVLVAKYLEIKRNDPSEPIWKLFFGDKTLEELENKWGKKLIDKETREIFFDPEIVAAIAIRYVIGHYERPPPPDYILEKERQLKMKDNNSTLDPFYYKNAFEKLAKVKVIFTFENPELTQSGAEGLQRVIRAKHMYYFAKAVETWCNQHGIENYIRLLIDPGHWQHNKIDTLKELESVPDDFGKYVFAAQIYYPEPVHAHTLIEIGTEVQRIIYEYFYLMRKKGWKDGVVIYEIGARQGQQPAQFISTGLLALRMVIEHLEKDILPTKLPLEFYGVSPEGFYSPQRQHTIIKDHAMDPLKGLIVTPEEEFTFLGKAATEKPGVTPEKWKKEELR